MIPKNSKARLITTKAPSTRRRSRRFASSAVVVAANGPSGEA